MMSAGSNISATSYQGGNAGKSVVIVALGPPYDGPPWAEIRPPLNRKVTGGTNLWLSDSKGAQKWGKIDNSFDAKLLHEKVWEPIYEINELLVTGAPYIVSNFGQQNIFVVGRDGNVWVRSTGNGASNDWGNIGKPAGTVASPVCAVSRKENSLNVIAWNSHGELCMSSYDGSWSGWDVFGSPPADNGSRDLFIPSLIADTEDSLQLFVNYAGDIWQISWNSLSNGGEWTSWTQLTRPSGDTLTGAPSAVAFGEKNQWIVFVADTFGNLYFWCYSPPPAETVPHSWPPSIMTSGQVTGLPNFISPPAAILLRDPFPPPDSDGSPIDIVGVYGVTADGEATCVNMSWSCSPGIITYFEPTWATLNPIKTISSKFNSTQLCPVVGGANQVDLFGVDVHGKVHHLYLNFTGMKLSWHAEQIGELSVVT